MENSDMKYTVYKLEDRQRTEDELALLGVVYLEDLSELKSSALKLNTTLSDNDRLIDFDLAVTQIGRVSEPKWLLHDSGLDPECVEDIYKGKNMYDIYLSVADSEPVVAFKDIHIRSDYFQEDVEYYVQLDMDTRSQEYPTGNQYVH